MYTDNFIHAVLNSVLIITMFNKIIPNNMYRKLNFTIIIRIFTHIQYGNEKMLQGIEIVRII